MYGKPSSTKAILATVIAVLALAFGAGSANASTMHAANPYTVQAERAGLTTEQTVALQKQVGVYLAQTHGRQTGPNTIAVPGGQITVAVPGEKYARDLRTTLSPLASASSCSYENFCSYTAANYGGTERDYYYCGYYNVDYSGSGSWVNNQTGHKRVYMYGSAGTVIYTTPNAYYASSTGNWTPVYGLKTCITAA